MSSCNFNCDYCTVKKFLKPVDYKFTWTGSRTFIEQNPNNLNGREVGKEYTLTDEEIDKLRGRLNAITVKNLMPWVDKYLDSDKWIIEITGGEPGLHPEINEIIIELSKRGFKGFVKTNGSTSINKNENFIRITAWHKGKEFPQNYDKIVIIKNPDDNWEEKIEHCKKNRIQFRTTEFNDGQTSPEDTDDEEAYPYNDTKRYCHINSMGQITKCPKDSVWEERTIQNMSEPECMDLTEKCFRCKVISDVEMWLNDKQKERFKKDHKPFDKTREKHRLEERERRKNKKRKNSEIKDDQ